MFKKIKRRVLKIIYILVVIYLFIFTPILIKERPLVIVSGSMEPALKVGGIFYYHKKDYKDYKIGDILVYKLNDHIISHRIYDIDDNGIITKGDANNTYDSFYVNKDQIMGEGTNWCIPFIGYYINFIYTHKIILWILIFIILIDMLPDKKVGVKG